MRSSDEQPRSLEGAIYRELRVLEEVDRTPDLSQRRLASQLDIALGVANLLLRSMAKQGYIRVTQLGWKRWAYALTPSGMARKLFLTKAYVERFVDHYQRVRRLLREDLGAHPIAADSRVALVGASEMAELAYLALRDIGVSNIDVYSVDHAGAVFLGMEVRAIESMAPADYAKVLVAEPELGKSTREALAGLGLQEAQVVELFQAHMVKLPRNRVAEGAGTDGV